MLSHSENQSAAHGPTRYSSLRQVTSTNEQPDTDLSKHGHLQSSLWDNTLQLTDQPNRKVFTLGVHDGFSTASIALFDLSAFPRNSIGSGSPITIAPASEIDLAIEEDSPSGNVEFTSRGSLVSERRDGKSKYLFVAEPMDPDMITKSPGVQVCIFSAVSWCYLSTLILLRSPSAPATRQGVV